MKELPEQAKDFWDLPYGERRMVLFVDSESFGVDEGPEWKWYDLFTPAILLAPVSGPSLIFTLRTYYAKKGIAFAQPVPIGWGELFTLPPGHPRADVLYVAHPRDELVYIPAGDFHRFAFEQKFSEAVRLLMHLGATEIKVHRKKGWGSEFAAHISASLPMADTNVDGGAGRKKAKGGELLYEAALDGTDSPALPEDDLIWYPYEPTWENMAEGRLKFGLKSFSLMIHYTDDYGVNADLAAKAKGAGVNLAGSFESHEETIWRISGTFG